jgi:uncharacterized membrane protein YoaK (UPF0700 family)
MTLKSWIEKKIHKLTMLDFSVLKIALVLLGIIVGAYISVFVKQYVLYFVVVFAIAYIILLFRIFKKEKVAE